MDGSRGGHLLDCIAILVEAFSASVQLSVAVYIKSNDKIQYWRSKHPMSSWTLVSIVELKKVGPEGITGPGMYVFLNSLDLDLLGGQVDIFRLHHAHCVCG